MVFSSLPAYLDTTPNLNQVIGSSSSSGNNLIPHHGGGSAVLRPGSMAERARLANIQIPESALRCPRCDSTNTKFCYYNNYNLSQPRHFCKSCRRYWTRGGALRNVPVGGGCRRNKRSKAKSQTRSHRQTTTAGALPSNTTGRAGAGGLIPQLPPVRLIPQPSENFNVDDFLSSVTLEPLFSCSDICPDPWRFHQAPPFGFVDPVPGFESPFILSDMLQAKHPEPLFTQVESVKTEGNPEMNFPRQVMGAKLLRNDQWSNFASSWNDFCSPSTSNRM